MASRMMHYAITLNILKNIEVKDKERFIIGSLVPDACSHEDGSYNDCHFWGISDDGMTKGINWSFFEEKYGAELKNDSLYLGYWCHLIEDALWFCNVADRFVRKHPREIRGNYYAMGYRDYARLNNILVTEYKLTVPDLSIMDIPILEVPDKYVENHINGFLDEFVFDKVCGKDELELYKWDVINGYIEECTRLCIDEINGLREKAVRVNPEQYYVSV